MSKNRAMIARDNGEVETKSKSKGDQMLPLEDAYDDHLEYPVKGEALVARLTLSVQVKDDDMEQ